MRTFLIGGMFFLLCSTASFVPAQSDLPSTFEEYIRNYQPDYALLITNAHQIIRDHLHQQNFSVVNQTIGYMDSLMTPLDDEWLRASDRFLIHWIETDIRFCTSLDHLSQFFGSFRSPVLSPPVNYYASPSLATDLIEYIDLHRDSILAKYHQQDLTADTLQFVDLLSRYLLQRSFVSAVTGRELNDQATRFLTQYPESVFSPLVRNHIRQSYRYSGLAVGGRIGYGYSTLSEQLHLYFPSYSHLMVRVDFVHEPWVYFIETSFSAGLSPKMPPRILQEPWPEDSRYEILDRWLGLGYRFPVIGTKVAPYLGIGTWNMTDGGQNSSYETPYAMAYKIGAMFEIPFHRFYVQEILTDGTRQGGSLWLQLEYNHPIYTEEFHPTLTGGVYSIQVVLGWSHYYFERVF